MLRTVVAIVVAVVSWLVIATILNLGLRLTWHDYATVERAMKFTLAMLLARLALGIVSSLGAGLVVTWISHSRRVAALCLVGLLLVVFLPEHYLLWHRFPIWYHLVFFASLVIIPLLGAKLYVNGVIERGGRSIPQNAGSAG